MSKMSSGARRSAATRGRSATTTLPGATSTSSSGTPATSALDRQSGLWRRVAGSPSLWMRTDGELAAEMGSSTTTGAGRWLLMEARTGLGRYRIVDADRCAVELPPGASGV